jgi:lysophospholipase L1-like esterase
MTNWPDNVLRLATLNGGMRQRFFWFAMLALGAGGVLAETPKPWPPPRPAKHDFAKWEKDVAKFEQADREKAPKKGAVLFVGSSTIVRWKSLKRDFHGAEVLNRGFGGNQIKDTTYYAERIIFPYEPSVIVLRAGGNDINAGYPAAEVFADFKKLVSTVRARLPKVPVVYIGLSPTVKRVNQIAEGNKLNDLIAAWANDVPDVHYIETRTSTLGPDGQPRADLFVEDMLHLNKDGYRILADLVRPVVMKLATEANKE